LRRLHSNKKLNNTFLVKLKRNPKFKKFKQKNFKKNFMDGMKMNNKQDKVLKSSLLKMFLLLISFKMMKKFKEEKERFKQ